MSRPVVILLYAAAVMIVVSCRREAAVPAQADGGPTVTSTTLTGPPQDLSNAQINTAIAPDTGRFVNDSRVGSSLGADGLVAEPKSEFTADEDIHLSLWLNKTPSGLQTRAALEDAGGKVLETQIRPMKGEPTVTFTFSRGKLPPGNYKILGYWGGNIAAEHEITVAAAPAKSPAKAKGKARAKSKG